MIDYHVHIERGPYTLEWLQEFWAQAKDRGIHEIGITEHTHGFKEFLSVFAFLTEGDDSYPYMRKWIGQDFKHSISEYLDLLHKARAKGMPIKIGLEVDYFPGCEEAIRGILSPYSLDYLIGSVHVLGKWGFDHGREYGWDEQNVDEAYQLYFQTLTQAAQSNLFQVLGHLDVIKLFGHRPQSSSVEHELDKLLETVSRADLAIEISTAGLRKPVQEIYPAEAILRKAADYHIPITISSDAHEPHEVGYRWEQAVLLARECGYREYRVFNQGKSYAEKLPKLS